MLSFPNNYLSNKWHQLVQQSRKKCILKEPRDETLSSLKRPLKVEKKKTFGLNFNLIQPKEGAFKQTSFVYEKNSSVI